MRHIWQVVCRCKQNMIFWIKMQADTKQGWWFNTSPLIKYTTVIRPVLEYANVLWHHFITVVKSDRLEALQKRALRIISLLVWDMPYSTALQVLNLDSLHSRRVKQGMKFFDSICQTESCLNHLLPSKRDTHLTSRLRHPRIYPTPITRTHCYCSFINYALTNYQ